MLEVDHGRQNAARDGPRAACRVGVNQVASAVTTPLNEAVAVPAESVIVRLPVLGVVLGVRPFGSNATVTVQLLPGAIVGLAAFVQVFAVITKAPEPELVMPCVAEIVMLVDPVFVSVNTCVGPPVVRAVEVGGNVYGAGDQVWLAPGAAVTVNVTGTLSGLLLTPAAVKVTVPLYVPAARPVGLAVTLSVFGVVLVVGVTVSQVPPLVTATEAVYDTAEPLLMLSARLCGGAAVPPAVALNVRLAAVTERVGAAAVTANGRVLLAPPLVTTSMLTFAIGVELVLAKVAVIEVALTTVTALMLKPVTAGVATTVAPVTKFVPVRVTPRDLPCASEAGAIDVSVGATAAATTVPFSVALAVPAESVNDRIAVFAPAASVPGRNATVTVQVLPGANVPCSALVQVLAVMAKSAAFVPVIVGALVAAIVMFSDPVLVSVNSCVGPVVVPCVTFGYVYGFGVKDWLATADVALPVSVTVGVAVTVAPPWLAVTVKVPLVVPVLAGARKDTRILQMAVPAALAVSPPAGLFITQEPPVR
jgi:hypothetical protein